MQVCSFLSAIFLWNLSSWIVDGRLLAERAQSSKVQKHWFEKIAEHKRCKGGELLPDVQRPAHGGPQGCFQQAWKFPYFSVDTSDGEYKCFGFAYSNMDPKTQCADGAETYYRVGKGEPPVERNKTASFHR
mmetsp:Transcript_27662/g.43185  ORF Transcript_27662/g.43185 Transcript_27662/m.43185 type:complete len:131 (-) Transcript_27662:52-444(-)